MRGACLTLVVMSLLTWALAGMVHSPALADSSAKEDFSKPPPEPVVSVLIYLQEQVDLPALEAQFSAQRATLRQRHKTVVRSLQDTAQATQPGLIGALFDLRERGLVRDYRPFWIANCVRVDAPQHVIDALSRRADVARVYPNFEIELIAPVDGQPDNRRANALVVEPGVAAINADDVWALGYTGAGVLVANIDTGVDGNHPALASRWAGLRPEYANHPEWAWFDPYNNQNNFPYEGGSGFGFGHGTHTMGTVCGGPPGDQIGVAPGAHWIAAGAIDRGGGIPDTVADAIESFEWMIDPDGNPNTNWDVPAVCSNSWGLVTAHGYPPCDELFWSYLDACEAAGIVMVFSAGNEGSAPNTLRRPSDRATDDYRTLAVAAVNANQSGWPIADFSSRGPTTCTPSGDPAIKPDIAAPGVSIRSAAPGSSYSTKDGTSMASPHVNGVIALMREACPDLTVQEVKQVIYDTAFDLGSSGEDNSYGWGMIDAYEAVLLALDLCGPSPPRVSDGYYETPVDTPVMISLQASDHDGGPMPISYMVTALPEAGHPITDIGNDHTITAGELPYTLVDNGNQLWYSPSGGYYGYESFQFKATDSGIPPEGGESEAGTVTVLTLFDPPEIITDALPTGYLNVAYGPIELEVSQGQPPLQWSTITDEYLEVDLEGSQFNPFGFPQGWHDDDDSWSYNLPFVFPFYGQDYTTVWLTSNGIVNLDGPDNDWSNTDSELIAATRIAPLWDDLRTDLGGDIFINAGMLGQVTFTWFTVTYADQAPCNHSCTLYSDGRIRFDYGTGNHPLTATVGISKGDGENYLLSSYNNAVDLENANSLEFVQPVPLPDGMSLSVEGLIAGTPVQSGSFEPRFKVVDSLGRSDEKLVTLIISEQGVPGDLDGDGDVDASDLALLLGAWGANPGDPADINGDGMVDAADLALLLGSWT